MRNVARGALSLAMVMFVVSCSSLLKKRDSDAGSDSGPAAEVSDAAAVPGPAALATNEGDIARFPDETKLADVRATVQQNFNVREAPPAGTIILGLPKGTAVTQIAQREKSVLIVFDNPKAPGTKLMGWIHRDAFSAVAVDAGPLQCAKGEIPVFEDTIVCGKPCSADGDCPAGQACKGSANKVLPNGKVGDGVTVCTAFKAPTPPAAVDAGKPAVVDAGKPDAAAPAPAVVDAGKAPAPTPPSTPQPFVMAAKGGKCDAGFVFVTKTGKCHRPCDKGADFKEKIANCRNPAANCIKCDKDLKWVCTETQSECR